MSEKINLWIISHIFPETISDIKADSFTQGFSGGYTEGFQRAEEIGRKEINQIIKLYSND